ncbi:MAG: class I SAM-dependent methyltransferase, partial [Paracoccaceae bacterium]
MDWIMFLDADEFLPFESNKELRHFLAANEKHEIISFGWKTLIPSTYWEYAVDGFEGREFYVQAETSSFTKIAFQPKKLSNKRYWINQGNHSISCRKGMDPLPMRQTNAVIFHMPIRSPNQLAIKLNQGVLSYMRKGTCVRSHEGEHWFKILEKMNESGSIAPDVLNGVAFAYGEPESANDAVSFEALAQSGYRLQPVDIAVSQNLGLDGFDARTDLAQLMLKLGGSFAVDGGHDEAPVVSALKTQCDGALVRAGKQDTYVYPKLAPRTSAEKAALRDQFATETDSIYALIKDSYQEITNLTPTSWGGHIPFMFALSSVVQPRRFVELGTHHGASFLAFCQATKRVGGDAEAVAIDCWEGDIQAGFYGNKVFEDFKYMIRPYEDFATYIRGFFEDAVNDFEDGSIDMLHIDGLHTYAAVK